MPASALEHQIWEHIRTGNRNDTYEIAKRLGVGVPEAHAALKRLKKARLVQYSSAGCSFELAYWYPHPRHREKFWRAVKGRVNQLYYRMGLK